MVSTLERAVSKPLVNKTVLRTLGRELRKLDGPGGRLQYKTEDNGANNHQRSWRYLMAQGDKRTKWLWTPQGILADLVCDEWRQHRASTKHAERYYYFPFIKTAEGVKPLVIEDLIPEGVARSLRHLAASGASGQELSAFVDEHADVILEYGKGRVGQRV